MLCTISFEELALYKAEESGTTQGGELKKLIHIEIVRKTARKDGWYLKEHKKGMVDHVVVPTFMVSEVSVCMFFIVALDRFHVIGTQTVDSFPSHTFYGGVLPIFCWVTRVN